MTVHWDRIYQQLEAARRNQKADFSLDEAARQQQLRARADLLARRPAKRSNTDDYLDVLIFRLGDEHFAVALTCIQTVVPSIKITPVPCTPSFIQGIVHIHGHLYSVINLRKFVKVNAQTVSNTLPVVVLRSPDAGAAAISIDEIITMRSIAVADIQPALSAANSVRVEYIRGITNDPLVIIDAPRILADQRLIVDETVVD